MRDIYSAGEKNVVFIQVVVQWLLSIKVLIVYFAQNTETYILLFLQPINILVLNGFWCVPTLTSNFTTTCNATSIMPYITYSVNLFYTLQIVHSTATVLIGIVAFAL